MRLWWLLALGLMALAARADAEIYKWVDEEGNVHYSDSPPPREVKSEVIEEKPAPPTEDVQRAKRQLEALLSEQDQSRAQREREQLARERERAAAAEATGEREQRCVYARKQLISLEQRLPVYRDEEGTFRTRSRYDAYEGEREYLDDATRASEVERVKQEIASTCERPDDLKAEWSAGRDRAMAKRCEAAQADLKLVLRPESKSTRDTIEKAQRRVATYCESGG